MQVILIKQERKLGKIGDIIEVATGFGKNYLIPKKIAIRATEANKALLATQKVEFEKQNAELKANAEKLLTLVNKKELVFVKHSSDDGRLFGSITNKEIAKSLSALVNCEISHSAVLISSPIKTLGVFHVEVVLHADVTAEVVVAVAKSESEALEALRVLKLPKESLESSDSAVESSSDSASL